MESSVRKIGNSLGIIIPKSVTDSLHLKEGDTVTVETEGNSIKLTALDPEFEKWTQAYNQLNMDYKEVLQALAK